jgi:hypothetical protein
MPIYRHFLPVCIQFFIASILLACSPAALALGPAGDAFLGFSRTGNDTFYRNAGGLNGWEGAINIKVKPLLGLEGDISHYGLGADSTIPRTTTLLFGPRITLGAVGIKVFGHFLVGGEHSANSGAIKISGGTFAYALGGGLDIPLAPFFAWRVMGDRISAPNQSPSTGTHARFSTGIVFRF